MRFTRLVVPAFVAVSLCQAEDLDIRELGSWPPLVRDGAADVAVRGDHAYVAAGQGGLIVMDVSDVTSPRRVATWQTTGGARDVALSGDFALVADDEAGIRVIDISTVDQLEEVAHISQYTASFVEVTGTLALVSPGMESNVDIYNIEDPTNPMLLGSLSGLGKPRAMRLRGDLAYFALGTLGIGIVDISDPTSPVIVGKRNGGYEVDDVELVGDHLIAVSSDAGLRVIDVSDPAKPTRAAVVQPEQTVYSIDRVGDFIITGDSAGILTLFDSSDPLKLRKTSTLQGNSSGVSNIFVLDTKVYATTRWGLSVVDFDGSRLRFLGEELTYDEPIDVASAGHVAYVVERAGLRVIDVSEPGQPSFIGNVSGLEKPWAIAVHGEQAFVADGPFGLRVFDVSDPETPILVGERAGSEYSSIVAVQYPLVFLAGGTSLDVYDVTNPRAPTLVKSLSKDGHQISLVKASDDVVLVRADKWFVVSLEDPANPQWGAALSDTAYGYVLAVTEERAFLGGFGQMIREFDLTDPTNPVELLWDLNVRAASDLQVEGDLLYAADRSFDVINIGVPGCPKRVGSHWTDQAVLDNVNIDRVHVSEELVYVFGGTKLQMLDVNRTALPQRIGGFDSSRMNGFGQLVGNATGVAIANDFAYLVDGETGLHVLDLSNAANPESVQNLDSFGSKDVVVVESVAYVSMVGLSLFDVSNPSQADPLEGPGLFDASPYTALIHGDHAFLVDHYQGLHVLDISNPQQPSSVGSITPFPLAIGIDGRGILHVVRNELGFFGELSRNLVLEAYDISDVTDAKLVGSLKLDPSTSEFANVIGGSSAMAIHDQTLYLALGNGLSAFDISTPAEARMIGAQHYESSVQGLLLEGNYAYFGVTGSGLRVVDVSDPTDMVTVGGNSAFVPQRIILHDGLIYAASGSEGLVVLRPIDSVDVASISLAVDAEGGLTIMGPTGRVVRIQRSEDLQQWTDWRETTLTEMPVQVEEAANLPQPAQYFRAR